ncbi:MAG: thiamine-phosphate kinase [Phycisphaeraceae bacterium]
MRELELLAHIYRGNARLPESVIVPPGDDMGGIRFAGETLLVTVDPIADGIHFDLEQVSLEQIGRKAINRNLSDVAAMAAKPVGAVVSACLPKGFSEEKARQLFDSLRETAERYACPLIGGDILAWDQRLVLTVTVFAEPGGIDPVLRRGAQVGDAVYVTGALGGSGERLNDSGYVHHLDFEPRIEPARQLAGHQDTRPTAMIDVSDGLALDLGRICRASGVSAEVECLKLPASDGAMQAARRSGRPVWHHALGDGEDYELCFTAPPGGMPDEIAGVPITCIGRIIPAEHQPLVTAIGPDGVRFDVTQLGWEHHG